MTTLSISTHSTSAFALRPVPATRVPATRVPGAAAARPRLRITRRGRAVVAVLIATPLALGAVALGLGQDAAASTGANGTGVSSTGATSTTAAHDFRWVTVGHGDTLWSIARRVGPDADPRDVIADIVQLNQLPSATVDAGERIAIPAKYRG